VLGAAGRVVAIACPSSIVRLPGRRLPGSEP
jgi:hypothetical protein